MNDAMRQATTFTIAAVALLSFALHTAMTKCTSLERLNLHHRMNFPSCRAPRLMKSVSAEPLNCRTYVCAGVVFVVPQEITSHPHFLRRVSRCPVARVR